MAFGGADNLKPIKKALQKQKAAQSSPLPPNWGRIHEVYNCLFILLSVTVFIVFLINSGIGYLSLREICEKATSDEAKIIWLSFCVMRLGDFFKNLSAPPAVTLRGIGYVALINRWAIIFQLLSVLGGYICLICGGGMLSLVIVMQSIVLLGVFRNYWLTKIVEEGRLWNHWKPKWSSEIFHWAKEPLWKGFVTELSKNGVFQVTGIILAFHATTANLASYLFSFNIARSIQSFAMSPFSSQLPRFAKLLAQTKYIEIKDAFRKRVLISQSLLAAGFIGIAVTGPFLLDLIGSQNKILPIWQWFALGGVMLYERYNTYCLAICASGNNMVLISSQILAGMISLALLFYLIPLYGVWGILFSLFLPTIIIMNIRPYYQFKKQLLSA